MNAEIPQPRVPWSPKIGQEVEDVYTGKVGRVTARNNAVEDEVRVTWAHGSPTWLPTTRLEPRTP